MIEKKLGEAPLVEPSAALDCRILALIEGSGNYRRRLFRHPVPLWASVVACVAFALLGFLASHWIRNMPPQPEPERILIYDMEHTEAFRNLLIREDKKTGQNFFHTKKSNIHIVAPQNISAESRSF